MSEASLNIQALAAALRDGTFTKTDLLLAAAQLVAARGTDAQILKERELTASAISGAIAFGHARVNPPPSDDHWLAPFWQFGRDTNPASLTPPSVPVAEDRMGEAKK